jgi:asparagine synthetase B (glutamine-hydrolysing)
MSRGPDHLGEVINKNIMAARTLLSITGYKEQPVQNDRFIILFNGEIYNDYMGYNEEYSDTDFLQNFIDKKGLQHFDELEGKYAVVIYDKKENSITLATDTFNTKPLYYQITKSTILIATFEEIVEKFELGNSPIRRVPVNKLITFNLKDFAVKRYKEFFQFDFSKQSKNSFEDWNISLEKSILRRTKNTKHPLFLPLSSGHDSGLIASEMLRLGIPFHAYCFLQGEDLKTLKDRIRILSSKGVPVSVLGPSEHEIEHSKLDFLANVEMIEFKNNLTPTKTFPIADFRLIEGTLCANILCKAARQAGELIGLFGNGEDEIYCDFYYLPPSNNGWSTVAGDWYSQAGPWPNFQGGCNEIFLKASDRICSHNSVEGRFPLLDRWVVQEFLYLHPDLKSINYKAPLTNKLIENNFPLFYGKFGFSGVKPIQRSKG